MNERIVNGYFLFSKMSKQSLNLKKELKCTGFCFLASSDLGTGKDTSVSLRLPERSDALS